MITFMFVFIAILIPITWYGYNEEMAWFFSFVGIIVGILGAIAVTSMVSYIVTNDNNTVYVKTSETQIIALQDNSSVSGSFFLGSGSIKGVMKYTYLTNTEDGIKMNQVNSESSYILEENASNPRIIVSTPEFTNKSLWWWATSPWRGVKTQIYIPKGSVKTNYNVDLE